MYTDELKQYLLSTARDSIRHGLQHKKSLHVNAADYPEVLRASRATFVTLKLLQQLRGCIGTTAAVAPLIRSVADNAYAAAFRDPRFPTLTQDEYDLIHVSISILTSATPVQFANDSDLLKQLRPQEDGLIIELGARRATFLPSVWETLSRPEDFLRQLKLKAGIPIHQPPERAWRYQALYVEE